MRSIKNVINVKSNYPHKVNVVVMSAKTFLNQVSLGLQDILYQLKNLFGPTIHSKIVVPNSRTRLGTLVGVVGTILPGPTPRGTGLSRDSTVGTPRVGTGSTSKGSTAQVRRWVWNWPNNRLQNLLSQIIVISQSNLQLKRYFIFVDFSKI